MNPLIEWLKDTTKDPRTLLSAFAVAGAALVTHVPAIAATFPALAAAAPIVAIAALGVSLAWQVIHSIGFHSHLVNERGYTPREAISFVGRQAVFEYFALGVIGLAALAGVPHTHFMGMCIKDLTAASAAAGVVSFFTSGPTPVSPRP